MKKTLLLTVLFAFVLSFGVLAAIPAHAADSCPKAAKAACCDKAAGCDKAKACDKAACEKCPCKGGEKCVCGADCKCPCCTKDGKCNKPAAPAPAPAPAPAK